MSVIVRYRDQVYILSNATSNNLLKVRNPFSRIITDETGSHIFFDMIGSESLDGKAIFREHYRSNDAAFSKLTYRPKKALNHEDGCIGLVMTTYSTTLIERGEGILKSTEYPTIDYLQCFGVSYFVNCYLNMALIVADAEKLIDKLIKAYPPDEEMEGIDYNVLVMLKIIATVYDECCPAKLESIYHLNLSDWFNLILNDKIDIETGDDYNVIKWFEENSKEITLPDIPIPTYEELRRSYLIDKAEKDKKMLEADFKRKKKRGKKNDKTSDSKKS